MAQNTKIEWTDHTLNLWWGCHKINAGCQNCYALTFSNRFNRELWGLDKPRKAILSIWKMLLKFQKNAAAAGQYKRVFVGSMMDIFEKPMPLVDHKYDALDFNTDQIRQDLFNNISNNLYPNLIFLFLTKRPSNINKYIPDSWKENPPKNVMFGTSVVDQQTFNTYSKQLLQVKGYRFLSVEPQLDLIDLKNLKGIDWIIQGGESGHKKRPFNIDWANKMKEQCSKLQIAYFFKQIDKIQEIPEANFIRNFPKLS